MTQRSARLDLIPLEARTVPSTVTASTDARPLTFELRGNVTNDQATGSGDSQTTTHYDGVVTAVGTLNYGSDTQGTSGTVNVTGAGTGIVKVGGSDPGTAFTNTLTGGFTVKDANGAWTTDTPFTGTATQTGPDAKTAGSTTKLGPVTATGTFDVSSYTVSASWDGPNGKGSFTGSVDQPLATKTDLTFANGSGEVAADGTVHVRFNVQVTGALMKAASEDTPAAAVTAVWQGDAPNRTTDPQTADAGFTVPVAWNAGTVRVDVAGLQKPDWAKTLVLKLDADNKVAEADETNNQLTITPTTPPPPPAPPPSGGTSGIPSGDGQTPPTHAPLPTPVPPPPVPPPAVVGVGLSADGRNRIQWRLSDGSVKGNIAPFGPGYVGSVNLAAADFNADGVPDAVATTGPGGGPRVVLIDGATGQTLASFFAYDPSFTGGVNVAVGDVDGNGQPDIITGAGDGGGSVVNVFAPSGQLENAFYAYDPSFRNGVRVVAADLDGNGAAEVVTGTGPGGGPAVAIFEGNGVYVDGFLAGPADARGGVTVKVTTDSNGKASISAVPGPNRTAPATTTTTGAPVTAQPFPSARPSGLLPADGVFPS